MSPNALAQNLLRYCGSTSLVIPGAVTADIGGDALQDALNRGWLRPDPETGFLCLTDNQGQLAEMRELAATPEGEAAPKLESSYRNFAMGHSGRNLMEAFGTGLSGTSTGAMGVGPGTAPSGAMASGQPPRSVTPTAQPPGPHSDYMVGEDVVVADEGKSYQAKVQAKNPDGTYKLSFGPNRPTKQDRLFRREEMQKIQPERENTVKVVQ